MDNVVKFQEIGMLHWVKVSNALQVVGEAMQLASSSGVNIFWGGNKPDCAVITDSLRQFIGEQEPDMRL